MTLKQEVGIALISQGKDRKWLCEEVTKRAGMYMDNQYLTNILSRKRPARNAVQVIKDILGIGECDDA